MILCGSDLIREDLSGDLDDLRGRLLVRRQRFHRRSAITTNLAAIGVALGIILMAFLLWPWSPLPKIPLLRI